MGARKDEEESVRCGEEDAGAAEERLSPPRSARLCGQGSAVGIEGCEEVVGGGSETKCGRGTYNWNIK